MVFYVNKAFNLTKLNRFATQGYRENQLLMEIRTSTAKLKKNVEIKIKKM